MSDNKIFKVSEEWSTNALINAKQYESDYSKSFDNNEEFWKEQGNRIDWITPYTKVKDVSYQQIARVVKKANNDIRRKFSNFYDQKID